MPLSEIGRGGKIMEQFQVPQLITDKLKDAGGNFSQSSWTNSEQMRADALNSRVGNLDASMVDCSVCLNRGYIAFVDDSGMLRTRECQCMGKRRSLKRIQRSGLSELLQRYTLETWEAKEPWQGNLADMVRGYADNPSGWFFLAGRPGTGKTHLCTALCGLLMDKGLEVRYLLWRDFSSRAKAVINDEETYRHLVEPMKSVPVLYIDDLFKTGKGQSPTTGDVNLAFEILNSRYNDERLLTVVSSELTVEKLLDVDEAVGSRVYERSKECYANLSTRDNWRLKDG